jgi:hypothetical protein
MTDTAQLPTDRWPSIDDALGPAAGRYFGTGYKQTGPSIGQVQVRHDAQASRLAGHGSVTGDKLSTTDAVALVTEALVGLVAARYSPEAARETRMIALDLRASAKPLGSPLDDFPVHARLSAETGGPLSIEASIGNITAVGQVVRPTEAGSLVDVDSAERLPSLFGVGEEAAYQGHTVALTGVSSRSTNEAEAAFEVVHDRARLGRWGGWKGPAVCGPAGRPSARTARCSPRSAGSCTPGSAGPGSSGSKEVPGAAPTSSQASGMP